MSLVLLDSYPDAGNFVPLLVILVLAVAAIAITVFAVRRRRNPRQ